MTSFILVGGVAQILYAFRARSWGAGLLTLLQGGLALVCGLLMLAHPLLGLAFLALLLATWFLLDGVFRIVHALELRPLPGWGFGLVSGIAGVVLAALIWRQWPLSGGWAVGVLAGINLALGGATMIGLGLAARRGGPGPPLGSASA